jgi:hypothetical protein
MALKTGEVGKGVSGCVKSYGGCWFLWPLCVLGYISVVVVEGVCVSNCRGLGLCAVGRVGWSAGSECVGERSSVVTGLGRLGGESEDRGKSGREGEERVVGRENNGL